MPQLVMMGRLLGPRPEGEAPEAPPPGENSLDFSDATNSMYFPFFLR